MILVVGGHSRNIGKTSVVTGLIQAVPEGHWTAVKITRHLHQIGSDAARCDAPYALSRQTIADRTDSGRYLAAGARRSYWLRTGTGDLKPALPALGEILESSENAIVESNSVLQFIKPDLYLVVLDLSVSDLKESSGRYMDSADAFVCIDRGVVAPSWKSAVAGRLAEKPRFPAVSPDYVSAELAQFIRKKL